MTKTNEPAPISWEEAKRRVMEKYPNAYLAGFWPYQWCVLNGPGTDISNILSGPSAWLSAHSSLGGAEHPKEAAGLWRNNPATPEGKYLLIRRDGTIPEWPFFAIGAKDPCASKALLAYANEAERIGMNLDYVRDIIKLAQQFHEYRIEHGHGDPDRGRHRKDDPATIEKMRKGSPAVPAPPVLSPSLEHVIIARPTTQEMYDRAISIVRSYQPRCGDPQKQIDREEMAEVEFFLRSVLKPLPTPPAEGSAELEGMPQWVKDLAENSKRDDYHIVGSELRAVIQVLVNTRAALRAAMALSAQSKPVAAEGSLPAHPPVLDYRKIQESDRKLYITKADFTSYALDMERLLRAALAAQPASVLSGDENRELQWAIEAFGEQEATSIVQRGVRHAEEGLETAQACGVDAGMIHKLVDHVWSKPKGELFKEIGGSRLTLRVLAQAAGLDADEAERVEFARVLTKPLEHFRQRNQAKNDAGFLASAPVLSGEREAPKVAAEARELLLQVVGDENNIGMIVPCNTQDPYMHEEECPRGYKFECGRCEYKHAVEDWLLATRELLASLAKPEGVETELRE